MATLEERLRLVVDATTGKAETSFGNLTTAAEKTARASDTTADAVKNAADVVARARAKEADSVGKLSVAQARLDELRAKGNASTSQLVAAEERVASAQREVQRATGDTATAMERQNAVQDESVESADRASKGADRFGDQLGNVKTAVAGLIAGVSLADWLSESVTGFADGARSAAAMATSMNATVEQAGAFLGLVGSVGLELDDLIEIQAEFATKTKDGLTQLGTELQHNADGTVNWTGTLVDTLAQLQKIPDATERNRLGFSMFGEEGFKQLSRLLNSGVDVEEALERIGTPFTEADVAATREYDAAMYDLSATSGELGRTIGRAVLPVLTGLITAARTASDVVGAIPAPLGLAAVASVLLGIAMRSAGTEGGFLATRLAVVTTSLATYRAAAATTIATNGLLGASAGVARGAMSGLMSLVGGPVGAALLVAAGAFYLVSEGAETFEENARKAAVESELARQKFGAMAASSEELGARMIDDAGAVDGWVGSVRGARIAVDELGGATEAADTASGGLLGTLLGTADAVFDLGIAEAGAAAEIDKQREALGAAGLQTEVTQVATRTLNDLIAEGTTAGREFTDAITATAEAQADETRTTDLAKAAIDAYNATTRDAVQTTLDLFSAQLGQRDGLIGVQQAFYELSEVIDDAETPWNEITEATNRAIESTLSYAGTASDAAVEAARAAGTVLDPLTEAGIRADATIAALRESLADPNMTADARGQIETLIAQLVTAQETGNIEALLTLTGADEAAGTLDETTEDRQTEIKVETRGGPAVVEYLDRVTKATRLAIIRVESRGGPAVAAYLGGLARERLAIIRVETRGGPAVDRYLDSLARDRTATINPSRGAGAPGGGGSGLRGAPGLMAAGGPRVMLGSVTLDLELTGRVDRRQVASAERGRAAVADVRAYERENGTGWRRS